MSHSEMLLTRPREMTQLTQVPDGALSAVCSWTGGSRSQAPVAAAWTWSQGRDKGWGWPACTAGLRPQGQGRAAQVDKDPPAATVTSPPPPLEPGREMTIPGPVPGLGASGVRPIVWGWSWRPGALGSPGKALCPTSHRFQSPSEALVSRRQKVAAPQDRR